MAINEFVDKIMKSEDDFEYSCKVLQSFVNFIGSFVDIFCNFTVLECGSNQFWCSDKTCLLKKFVCDRVNDCGDFSDERNCS